jgi:hypothetical protein
MRPGWIALTRTLGHRRPRRTAPPRRVVLNGSLIRAHTQRQHLCREHPSGFQTGCPCSNTPPRRCTLARSSTAFQPGNFFNPATAVWVTRPSAGAKGTTCCLPCPNARHFNVPRPRLAAARDQAQQLQASCEKTGRLPKLQQVALTGYITELDTTARRLEW